MAKRYQNSGIISEDYSATSNLPQNDMIKTVAKTSSVMTEMENNGISTIDKQINADMAKLRSIMNPANIS